MGTVIDAGEIAKALLKGDTPPKPTKVVPTSELVLAYAEAVMLQGIGVLERMLKEEKVSAKDAVMILKEIKALRDALHKEKQAKKKPKPEKKADPQKEPAAPVPEPESKEKTTEEKLDSLDESLGLDG